MELLIAIFGLLFYGIKGLFSKAGDKSYEARQREAKASREFLKKELVDPELEKVVDDIISAWPNKQKEYQEMCRVISSGYDAVKNTGAATIKEQQKWVKELYLSKLGKMSSLAFDFGYRVSFGVKGRRQLKVVACIEDNLIRNHPQLGIRFYGNDGCPLMGSIELSKGGFSPEKSRLEWRKWINEDYGLS